MKNQLVNTNRISISNFTFDNKTNTISFFSTKTNKCWGRIFSGLAFARIVHHYENIKLTQKELNSLKKLIKNGTN